MCHTIITDQRTGKFNASSPDELALIYGAKFFGSEFITKDESNYMVVNFLGKEIKYRLLNVLEFSSARKRMSVVVQDESGNL